MAVGTNKKVFDCTSSWDMYSPVMKLRQRKFEAVDFPFTYAEVESSPIYVAMIHHLVSEARVPTDTFVDIFGKMGYIPAFCAEGYTKAFTAKNKFLRKNNTPIVFGMAKIALEQGIEPEAFRAFINDFANALYPTYEEASGSGNIKIANVNIRLQVMFLEMCGYFSLKSEDIQKPFKDKDTLSAEEIEELLKNHETNQKTVSSGKPEKDGIENSEEYVKFAVGLMQPVENMEGADEDSPVMEEKHGEDTGISDESESCDRAGL